MEIKLKNLIKLFIILVSFLLFTILSFNVLSANNLVNLKQVYKLLNEKRFDDAISGLEVLSNKNRINAQYLFSQILFSGNIVPQNFEKAYFWSNVSNLGGFKKSQKIIKLIDNYLDEKQKIEINNDIKTFLEKLSMKKNKLAIIQIAKWHLELSEEIDYINAYKWYNVAVAIGIKSAAKRRDEIIDELSAEEIFDAQKKSNNIFKKINKLGG